MNKLERQFIALNNKVEKMAKMQEKTIAKNYKKVLDNLRISMAKLYSKYEIEGQLTFEQMSKYDRLKKLDKEVYEMIVNLYKSNTNIIKGTLKGIATETYNNTISMVEGATEKKLKGIVKALRVDKVINNEMAGLHWGDRVGKHRTDLIYDINKEIRRGLTQGDTYGTMTKRLKKELGSSTAKTNQIVRTEGHRVFSETQRDSLDSIAKHGVVMTKKWVSSKDERTRSQHSEMDGVVIPYEEDFIMPDGSSGKMPGLIGEPQHDIYCRCVAVINIVTD